MNNQLLACCSLSWIKNYHLTQQIKLNLFQSPLVSPTPSTTAFLDLPTLQGLQHVLVCNRAQIDPEFLYDKLKLLHLTLSFKESSSSSNTVENAA